MLYFLWDLGLKVGHATRSVAECLAEGAKDATIRTSLLDARHLAGDAALFEEFHDAFPPPARRRARRSTSSPSRPSATVRHRRFGDSPFVVEPNMKEGRGGLRDLQTLYWIARYVYGTQTMAELADVGRHPDPGRGAPRAPRMGVPVDACDFTFTTWRDARRSG